MIKTTSFSPTRADSPEPNTDVGEHTHVDTDEISNVNVASLRFVTVIKKFPKKISGQIRICLCYLSTNFGA